MTAGFLKCDIYWVYSKIHLLARSIDLKSMESLVRVPVLSKHIVSNIPPYIIWFGDIVYMSLFFNFLIA
jgi:hypothetical protein